MTVYQIDYDLQEPGQDYDQIHEKIRELGDTIWPLESTWFVETDLSVSDVRSEIEGVTDQNDYVIVTKFVGTYSAYLQSDDIEWLREHS
jgi:hypothetical protein